MDKHMFKKGVKHPVKAVRYVIDSKRGELWAESESTNSENYLRSVDEELWDESVKYTKYLKSQYDRSVYDDIVTSGGGACEILYFFVRTENPDTVVETGVSAGWSSRAILDSLEKNGEGKLISNDLPYSEQSYKENYLSEDEIGFLVHDELGHRWDLRIGSDRENLPEIISSVDSIDIFHYDSDKSYQGREFAMEQIRPKLHEESIIIMDDVCDNTFFKNFVREYNLRYKVLEPYYGGNEVGIIYGI